LKHKVSTAVFIRAPVPPPSICAVDRRYWRSLYAPSLRSTPIVLQ